MGHEDTVLGQFQKGIGQLLENGSAADHLVIDTGQTRDKWGNGALGVHQGSELIDYFVPIMPEKGNLGDFVALDAVAGGLYVDYGVHKLWFQIQFEFMHNGNGFQIEI